MKRLLVFNNIKVKFLAIEYYSFRVHLRKIFLKNFLGIGLKVTQWKEFIKTVDSYNIFLIINLIQNYWENMIGKRRTIIVAKSINISLSWFSFFKYIKKEETLFHQIRVGSLWVYLSKINNFLEIWIDFV
jgi:hypothetical protein